MLVFLQEVMPVRPRVLYFVGTINISYSPAGLPPSSHKEDLEYLTGLTDDGTQYSVFTSSSPVLNPPNTELGSLN